MKVKWTFVDKSIQQTWEAIKHNLIWKRNSLRAGLSFNDHCLWWSLVILQDGKPLIEIV